MDFDPQTPMDSPNLQAALPNLPQLPKNLLEIVKGKYMATESSNLEKIEEQSSVEYN